MPALHRSRRSAPLTGPRRSVTAAVIAAALLLGTGAAALADDSLATARAAWEAGDTRTAVVVLKDRLQRDPGDRDARLLLGRVGLDAGDPRGAAQEAERVLAVAPADVEALRLLAEALLAQARYADVVALPAPAADAPAPARAALLAVRGQARLGQEAYDAAEALFAEALALDATAVNALVGQALVLAARGDVAAARAALVTLTGQHPDAVEVWQALGSLDFSAGRPADAVVAYSEALERARVKWPVHYRRGLANAEADRVDATRADLDALAAASPNFPGVQYLRGWVALRDGDPAAAAEALEAYLRVAPEDPRGIYFAALALYQTNRAAQAEEYLVRLHNQLPDNPSTATLLALLRLERNDAGGALALLEPIAASPGATAATLEVQRRALLARGRTDEADAVLERMVERFPALTNAQLLLAQQRQQAGDTAGAEALLRGVLAAEPDNAAAHQLLVRGLLLAGSLDAARAAAEAFVARAPDAALAHTVRAAVLAANQDTDGARAAFGRALELDPAFTRAAVGLAALELGAERGDAARQTLDDLLAADPTSTGGWLALAGLDARQRGGEASIERLRAAVAANPADLSLRLTTAQALLADGQAEAALALLRQATAEQAERPALMLLRAQAELDAGQTPAAQDTLARFAALQPESAQARFMLAAVKARADDPRGAEAALLDGLLLDRDQVLSAPHLGAVLSAMPDSSARRDLLDRLLEATPDHPRIATARAIQARVDGDLDDALRRFNELAARFPERQEVALGRAETLEQAGRGAEAAAAVGAWLDKHPRDLDAHLLQAQIALGRGQIDAAVPAYRAALELDPDHAVAMNNLAMLTAEADPAAALPLAERAVAQRPEDPAFLDTLGFVLLAVNEPARARDVLAKAHANSPDPGVAYHYARALAESGDATRARAVLLPIVDRAFPDQAAAADLLRSLTN